MTTFSPGGRALCQPTPSVRHGDLPSCSFPWCRYHQVWQTNPGNENNFLNPFCCLKKCSTVCFFCPQGKLSAKRNLENLFGWKPLSLSGVSLRIPLGVLDLFFISSKINFVISSLYYIILYYIILTVFRYGP